MIGEFVSRKKGFLKNFTKFTGKHLCQSLVFNNIAGLRPATLLKRDFGRIFDQLLIFVNLYQHAKNEAVSPICFEEIAELKILQSDWLRPFLFISQG